MNDEELARKLGLAVLAVPGVLQAYDARPVLAAVVADAATALKAGLGAALPLAAADAPLAASPVAIGRGDDGLTVSVKIAVSESRPAADTCRDVYAVLAEALAAEPRGDEVESVSVQISRIG